MQVLMLGWEFPPYISGGLGTACHGLTRALSRRDTHITFVLPKPIDADQGGPVRLLSPHALRTAAARARAGNGHIATIGLTAAAPGNDPALVNEPGEFTNVTFRTVAMPMGSPYHRPPGPGSPAPGSRAPGSARAGDESESSNRPASTDFYNPDLASDVSRRPISVLHSPGPRRSARVAQQYEGDLLTEAQRYAALCVELARHEDFDVIHAHDWLSFPAGMAVAAATGKPLVVHVHSTEFDRAGEHIDQRVYDIERRGTHAATRVIAVSHLTQTILEHRYEVDPSHIDVVYNGIDIDGPDASPDQMPAAIEPTDKIVLFLGRITMQKGPEYFVEAARKVLGKYDRVKFIMAGSGDKVTNVIELAARQGIGHKVLFTGFLHGADVSRVFDMADVYVMPSVSEPFGIAALEAIRHDVPVIVSRTSGVSEVVQHALKVDFWDTDDIADKILALLKHPPLSATLKHHADIETRELTWDGAADRVEAVYEQALAVMPAVV